MSFKGEEQWVEAFMLLFLAIGFVIAVLLRSPIFSYFSSFLGGIVCARVFYIKHQSEPILPFVLIIIGFLVGFLLGSFWASRFLILLFFLAGFLISYYLHIKKIVVIFKSKDFLK